MTNYWRIGNVSLLLHISHSVLLASYSIMYEVCYGVGEKKHWQANQAIYSFFDSTMFSVPGTKNTVMKKNENPFPVTLLSSSGFRFLVLTLPLTHWVTWANNFIFFGLNFPITEMANLGRVMSKGPLKSITKTILWLRFLTVT